MKESWVAEVTDTTVVCTPGSVSQSYRSALGEGRVKFENQVLQLRFDSRNTREFKQSDHVKAMLGKSGMMFTTVMEGNDIVIFVVVENDQAKLHKLNEMAKRLKVSVVQEIPIGLMA